MTLIGGYLEPEIWNQVYGVEQDESFEGNNMTVDEVMKEHLEEQRAIPNVLMAYMYRKGITSISLDEGDWEAFQEAPYNMNFYVQVPGNGKPGFIKLLKNPKIQEGLEALPDAEPIEEPHDLCEEGACDLCDNRHECAKVYRNHKGHYEKKKNPGLAATCRECTGTGMSCYRCSESRR
jgi:hypothetical protein